ncbi:MAG: hypothetical protein ACOYJY_03760 [Acutalibacteraceae bacterium]|jgi:hypothetical protein
MDQNNVHVPQQPVAPQPVQQPVAPQPVQQPVPVARPVTPPQNYAQPVNPGWQQPAPGYPARPEDSLPPQYKPLGAWAYFGYTILFSIPIVGFILLLVFSFSDANINRRNFARSYWCALLIVAIVTAVIALIALITGASLFNELRYLS